MVRSAGRLSRVQPGGRSRAAQPYASGHSHRSRRPDSVGEAGGSAYGSTPAACTRPSHAYRYRSSDVVGGPARAATRSARATANTAGMAERGGTRKTSATPINQQTAHIANSQNNDHRAPR